MQIYPIRKPEFRSINQNDVSVNNSEKKEKSWKGDPIAAPYLCMHFQDFCLVLKIAKDNNFYIPDLL